MTAGDAAEEDECGRQVAAAKRREGDLRRLWMREDAVEDDEALEEDDTLEEGICGRKKAMLLGDAELREEGWPKQNEDEAGAAEWIGCKGGENNAGNDCGRRWSG